MINLTPVQIQELIKCAKSARYFITTFAWLENKADAKIIPFLPFPFQDDVLTILQGGQSLLGLKSRRVGWSWIVAGFAAWLMNFHEGVNVLLLSKKESDAKILLDKVKFILKNLAYHDSEDFRNATKAGFLKGEIVVDNQSAFGIGYRNDEGEITTVSMVESLTTTADSGRSRDATFIFLDEFGFMPDDVSVWRSVRPVIARGGQWCAVSTPPRGVSSVFYRLCMEAKRGENKTYEYREVHWKEAGITEEEIRRATEGVDEDSIALEWELTFLTGGNAVFDPIHLSACYKPAEEYPEVDLALTEYRKNVLDGRPEYYYFSGVDTAVGKAHKKASSRDYSSCVVLTRDGIQAYAYHSKESLADWAGQTINNVEVEGTVTKIHREWPGFMQIEENGPGHTVINRHQLPNDSVSMMAAMVTTQKKKSGIIEQLKRAIQAHELIITDEFTYQCMAVYQYGETPGTYEAPPGLYDDPVMALAMAYDALLQHGGMQFSWGDDANYPRRMVQLSKQEFNYGMLTEGDMVNLRMADILVPYENEEEPIMAEDPIMLPNQELMAELLHIEEQAENSR